jgi:hypothetical protein
MEWVARHTTVTPLYVAFVACLSPDCACAAIPEERKKVARLLHERWAGTLPPTVRKGERFLSFLELMALPEAERAALVNTIPEEFNGRGWRRCKAADCCFWEDSNAGLQRHRQLRHPNVPLLQLFDKIHLCTFPLPRPVGPTGLPHGPYRLCDLSFASAKELKAHKDREGHKRKKQLKEEEEKEKEEEKKVEADSLREEVEDEEDLHDEDESHAEEDEEEPLEAEEDEEHEEEEEASDDCARRPVASLFSFRL